MGRVFAAKGTRSVHSMILNEKEWLSVLTTINANGDTISNFYIFKGIRLRSNYQALCESGATYGIQKGWVEAYQFTKWMDHFIHDLREKGLPTFTNRHLLIFDGHKAHLTLDVLTKARRNQIDMLTISSHTSHGLQPLDVACFKPFKVAFRAYKQAWNVRNHGSKVRKQDLASWILLALKKALTSANIRVGFKGSEIWPLNLEAMKSKMGPREGFIPNSAAEARFEEELNEEIMGEDIAPPSPHATHYYVDSVQEDVLGDDEDEEESPSTHDNISNFLRMPQEVVTIKKSRAEPFIDYFQRQIVTSVQHVDTLYSIAAKKEKIAKEREAKKVERELTKQARAAEKQKQREAKKQARMARNTP